MTWEVTLDLAALRAARAWLLCSVTKPQSAAGAHHDCLLGLQEELRAASPNGLHQQSAGLQLPSAPSFAKLQEELFLQLALCGLVL